MTIGLQCVQGFKIQWHLMPSIPLLPRFAHATLPLKHWWSGQLQTPATVCLQVLYSLCCVYMPLPACFGTTSICQFFNMSWVTCFCVSGEKVKIGDENYTLHTCLCWKQVCSQKVPQLLRACTGDSGVVPTAAALSCTPQDILS